MWYLTSYNYRAFIIKIQPVIFWKYGKLRKIENEVNDDDVW